MRGITRVMRLPVALKRMRADRRSAGRLDEYGLPFSVETEPDFHIRSSPN
ncbi:hypothetical protein [Xanthobacter sp. VNH20]